MSEENKFEWNRPESDFENSFSDYRGTSENALGKIIGSKRKKEAVEKNFIKSFEDANDLENETSYEPKAGWSNSEHGEGNPFEIDYFGSDDTMGNRSSDFNSATEERGTNFSSSPMDMSFGNDISSGAMQGAVVKKAIEIIKKRTEQGMGLFSSYSRKKKREKEKKKESQSLNRGVRVIVSAFASLLTFIISIFGSVVIPIILALAILLQVLFIFITTQSQSLPIVEAAQTELSMAESNIGGEKYKTWYGLDGDWCAMFVSYCSDQCGLIETGVMPRTASVLNMSLWYMGKGLWQDVTSGYVPKAGDIVFFQNGMSHVGIVVEYDTANGIITTIEGNTGSSISAIYHEGSRVMERKYPVTYPKISGYATPLYPETNNFGQVVMILEFKREEYAA